MDSYTNAPSFFPFLTANGNIFGVLHVSDQVSVFVFRPMRTNVTNKLESRQLTWRHCNGVKPLTIPFYSARQSFLLSETILFETMIFQLLFFWYRCRKIRTHGYKHIDVLVWSSIFQSFQIQVLTMWKDLHFGRWSLSPQNMAHREKAL